MLEADAAQIFPDAKSVNEALRALSKIILHIKTRSQGGDFKTEAPNSPTIHPGYETTFNE